jgi:hypothetical protein
MATDVPDVIRQKLTSDGFENVSDSGYWPDAHTKPNAILVDNAPSPRPNARFGGASERKRIGFQVWCRAETVADAKSTAQQVYDALRYHVPSGWISIRPIGQVFRSSEPNKMPVYSVNFMARINE